MLLLFGLTSHVLIAQTDFASEEEFKKQAAKLFDEEDFVKAYPLYSQLVSLYRKDPNYNYRLGVCMLFASDDKERAITFLEFSVKYHEVEKEAFFYLAKAYHLNYRFDEAITQYQIFKKIASAAKAERLQVDRQIEMCKNGKKLLRNISDLPVLEKTELGREDFFRSYNTSEIGGKLLVKPDEKEFRTNLDKKKNEKSILYLATNGNMIYFSSYGDNEQHGKDIFQMKKLPDGEWDKPQRLGNTINTDYDEDFPFLHPDGKVLYFCSKGHNSMGGYDIFKSTLNEETNLWNEPVNMDFPINTPDDDILYITDKDEKKAYFASARSSVAGKISLYHISVERRPIDFAIIRGTVIKNHKNQALNTAITVKNVNDNTILGIFNSSATGSYEIKLPNGGSFLFTIEAPDFTTQSEVVTVPVQKEFRALQQEISYDIETDKLQIKNLFDEAVSDSNYLLAINVIKEKSKLNVTPVTELAVTNTAKEDSLSTNETASVEQPATTKINAKLSNDDIVKIAYKDATVVDTEATDLREQADIALSFANQKNESAQSKLQEAAAKTTEASTTEDVIKKQALTDDAEALNKEAEQLNAETVVAFNLAKRLDATALSKREEADLSQQYAKGLEEAVKSKNPTEALAKLDELEQKIDALNLSNADRFPVLNSYKKEEENKKHELDQTVQESTDLKQELVDNETIIANLKTDADNAKSGQVKDGLNNQIAELKEENNTKQKGIEQDAIKIARLQKEYNGIKNETELVSTVIDQSKTGSSQAAAAKVASIDKNKLEQQVNSIKNTSQSNNNIVSSNATNKIPANNSIANNSPTNSNTPATITSSDINKQYADDLAATDDIKDAGVRETEKANVLKKWSEAIDDDVAKQKQIYISSTDPEMKALLAKKIEADENSSKEKKSEAEQSLAKIEALKQQNITANSTTTKTNSKDNSTTGDKVNANQLLSTTNNNEDPSVGNPTKEEYSDNTTISSNTSAETLSNINTKYSADLTATEKITNEGDRENEKANVLKKWAEAINADVAKQKQDLTATTDPEKKSLLSKKISDAENSSKEKQTLADQSLAKAKTLKQQDIVASTTTTVKTNIEHNSSTITSNATNATTANNNNAAEKQLVSIETPSSEETKKANLLNKQADTLLTYSLNLISKANNQSDPATKKMMIEQSEEVLLQAQEKKFEATKLKGESNKTEYIANKNQLEQSAKKYSSTTTDDISMADMVNDEALIYFEKAEKLRMRADTAQSYDEKEILSKDANKNELIALEKQKKSADLYKNHDTYVAALTTANKTSTTNLPDSAKNIASSNNSIQHNTVKEKQNFTSTSIESPTTSATNSNVKEEQNPSATSAATTSETGNLTVSSNEKANEKHTTYNESVAVEQISKADLLNTQADEFMSQSVSLKSQAAKQKNSETKNTLYSQSEELTKEAQDKKLQASQLTASANTTEYDANQNQLDQLAKATSGNNVSDIKEAKTKNDEAKKYFEDAKKQRTEADIAESYSLKEKKLEDAHTNEMLALEKQKESIRIYKKSNPNSLASVDNKSATNNTTSNPVSSNSTNPVSTSLVNTNLTVPTKAASINSEPINNAPTIASVSSNITLTANEVFEQKSVPIYSAKHPIPINEKFPEGLIFKVQIGAFRNPIPQNLFQGMSPITGETTSKGFIRYTVGVFEKFATADKVKNKIIGLGYKDAFLVAFLNGKRIPINEAYAMAGGIPATVLQKNATNVTAIENTVVTNPNNTQIKTSNAVGEIAKTQNVSTIHSLFYTVQVGVFSQPVLAAKLYNMKPLYNETTSNGNIRYYSGIYNSVLHAAEATEMINDIGIRDAFVTAFYNGKRITLAEAKQYEKQGDGAFSTDPNLNKLPVFNATQIPNIPSTSNPAINHPTSPASNTKSNPRITIVDIPNEEEPVITNESAQPLNKTTAQNNTVKNKAGIIFKVQIGAFNEEVPLDIANKFLKIAKMGINNYKDNNGLTVYTVGNLSSYEEANLLKAEVVSESLTDAFVIAFRDGKKISVEEARK